MFLAFALLVPLMNSSAPTPLYPLYQQRLGFSSTELSLVFGAYGLGVLASLISLASLAGQIQDPRRLMVPATLLVMLGAWLFSQGTNLWSLCLARGLAGLGAGAMTSAVNLALVRLCPADEGKLAALLGSLAMVLGLALGPVLSGSALRADLAPLALPFWLIIGLALLAMSGVLLLWPRTEARPCPAPAAAKGGVRAGLRGIGRPFHLCAGSVLFCWSFAACVFVIGPGAAERLLGLSQPGAFGYAISLYLLIAGASQILCQRLAARRALLVGLLLQGLALLMLLVGLQARSLVLASLGLIIGGVAYGAVFVASARLVNQMVPRANQAKLIAYFYTTVYLFNGVPIPLGLLVDAQGLQSAVSTSLWGFLMLGAMLFLLSRNTIFPQAELKAESAYN
ncbi:MFS transporter [Pseudomonas sp. NFXW11]|uniref:MFS transporter n=1 Tax=Pseudomonas sp. NFXW11 TaxID=2819531 RepID=UPI003CE72112